MISDVLLDYGCTASDPDELYSDMFHLGENLIQRTGEYRTTTKEFKGNPMIYVCDEEDYAGKIKRYILLEDTLLEQIHAAQQCPSNLINGISYYGKKKDKEHADKCFGMIFDLDEVDATSARNFMYAMRNGVYPNPNYIVISKSGKGLHLYYIFEKPIRLYPKIKIQLKSLKHALIRLMWNPHTSNDENPQYQSYDQSFMVAGTTEVMKVFKSAEKHWEIGELSDYVDVPYNPQDLWIESKYTLEEAREKFPEWYERLGKEDHKQKGTWTCKRDLYDWWKRQISSGASYGHRYWCVMALAIYAAKCEIPYEELEEDAYKLIPALNELNPDKPFTRHDVESALECYDVQFKTFPIDDISRLTSIPITKNKRNGRTQEKHLQGARAIRDINNDNWRENNGRKPKGAIVRQWQKENPYGTPKECIKETGLSKNTVYKWWVHDRKMLNLLQDEENPI